MKYNDKVNVYGADNRWHECAYIGKSPRKGHYIVYRNGKPWECADNMIELIKEETDE